MRTEDLIRVLAADHRPVGLPFGRVAVLTLALGALVTSVLFLAVIGFRPDVAQALATLRFPLKFAVTLALAIPACGLLLRLARPGRAAGPWAWAMAAAPLLLAVAVAAELAVLPAADWRSRLVGHNAWECLTLIPALSLIPLGCALWVLRRGAVTRPRLAGAVAGFLSAGIAATLYASNCTDDSPLFVATWYSIAVGVVALIGSLLGGRLLRW